MFKRLLEKVEYTVLATLMLGTTVLLFINVVMRYLFGSALFWVEETLRYCIVWITFLGIATCVKENSHISLDFLMLIIPGKTRRILALVLHLLACAASALLGYLALRFTIDTFVAKQLSSTIGGFPMYVVYSCMPLGFFVASGRSLQKFWQSLKRTPRASAAQQG